MKNFEKPISSLRTLTFLLTLCFFSSPMLFGQSFFTPRNQSTIQEDPNWIIPEKFDAFEVSESRMLSFLESVPMEFIGREKEKTIVLPYPDERGSMEFTIVESPIMEPELAAKFPNIKTYRGQGIDDPTAVMRMDMTPKGLHAIILGQEGTVFIDPYFNEKSDHYMAYFKHDFKSDKQYSCDLQPGDEIEKPSGSTSQARSGGGLKTYKLAMAATFSYTVFHSNPNPPTVAAGLAGIVTTVNRVNSLYERDLNIRMVLIANNNLIVYASAATDPYSSGQALLNENQANVDAVIGNAFYDIGHVMNAAGNNGIAPGDVCVTGNKAKAFTQSTTPQGDPFDIDFVAHEIGHQFSGAHSMNNFCMGASWGDPHAIEPGSGTTIMAYAGICSPDIQSNSDDYFHGMSISRITTYVTTGNGTCNGTIANSNDPPTFDHEAPNRTIPKSTAFFLHTSASDPENDALTYGIEQMDGETASMPPSNTATVGPAFRSYQPTTDTTVYFPLLDSVFANISPTWEVLSTVARNYEFLLTVRDNNSAGGCFVQDTVQLVVDGTAGPFAVVAPNGGQSYTGGQTVGISWNVSGTDNASTVNCQNVKIYCYIDVPNKTRFLLAEHVDNNGFHQVQMPNASTSSARIAVVAEDNYFYDVSNANFSISIAGDLCASALSIGCGDVLGGNTDGSTNAADASQCNSGFGSGFCNFGEGVWYTFIGTGENLTLSTDFAITDFDTELQLYTGVCGSLVCIGRNDDVGGSNINSLLTFPSQFNTVYHVYLDGNGITETGTYQLSLTCAPPPNDLQVNAIVITCDSTSVAGQTYSATTTGEPTIACVTSISAPGVWYKMDGTDSEITLDLCGSPYDSKINVYYNFNDSLVCIIGEDDDFGICGGNDPSVTFDTEVGKEYLIYVQGFNGEVGSFTLNISCECSGLVINTNDSGYGSLRDNVACATSGDTIRFSSIIDGDSIKLTSGQISISGKELAFDGNGMDSTIIDGVLDSFSRIFTIGSGARVTFNDLTIQNGGSVAYTGNGAGILLDGGVHVKLNRTKMSQHITSGVAASVNILDGSFIATNCVFTGNMANDGSVFWHQGPPNESVFAQCLFFENVSSIYALVHLGGTDLEVYSSTFSDNVNIVNVFNQSNDKFYNNIFNNSGIPFNTTPINVGNNLSDNAVNFPVGVDGNLLGDAAFVDASTNDYHLQDTSLAIEAGAPAFLPVDSCDVDEDGNLLELIDIDLDGNPRIHLCNLDIGCYENNNPGLDYVVTNTNDSGPGSLRAVIACALAGSTITFSSAIDGDSIKISGSNLNINKDLIIDGNGPTNTIIDGSLNPAAKMMQISAGIVMLQDLTIQHGGGASNSELGAGIQLAGLPDVTIFNCVFSKNQTSGVGGAIGLFSGTFSAINCEFKNNIADGAGSAIYSQGDAEVIVNQCFIHDNSGGQNALQLGTNDSLHTMIVTQSTIVNNTNSGVLIGEANYIVKNNIFATNTGNAVEGNVSYLNGSYNLVDNPGILLIDTFDNIQADAQFADAPNGDYRLTACSPGVNSGLDDGSQLSNDFDGNNRNVSWEVDRGVYEYAGPACDTGTCLLPIPIVCGQTYQGTNRRGANNLDGYSCRFSGFTGPEAIYEIEIVDTSQLIIEKLFQGGIDMFIMTDCADSSSCLDWSQTSVRANLAPGTYYLVIDRFGENVDDFEFSVNCLPPCDPVNILPVCGDTVIYPDCYEIDYPNNDFQTFTFCPASTDTASITFTYFDLESCCDFVEIFDNGVSLGSFGSMAIGTTFTAAQPGTCMTVVFTSDGSVTETGFAFAANCLSGCPPTLAVPGTPVSGTYAADNSLTSDGTILNGRSVIFSSPSIELQGNFGVELGGALETNADGCP